MNTFSGKRPRDRDMPYLSTSSYLRQMVGTEKQGKGYDPTSEYFLSVLKCFLKFILALIFNL